MTITTPPTGVRAPERDDDVVSPATARRAARRADRPARRRTTARSGAGRFAEDAVTSGAGTTSAPDRGAAPTRTPAGGRPARATTATASTTKAPERSPAKAPQKTARKEPPASTRGRAATPPRAPFVLLVVGLLGGTLVSLLLLNTVLAQDAFTLSELQRSNQQLSERKQALQEDIARESSPEVLHEKARNLGMKDPDRPAFIDGRTGRVTEGGTRPPGVPDEAMAAAGAAGVTGAPGALVPPADGSTPRRTGGSEGGRR